MNKKLLKIGIVGLAVGAMLLYMSIMGASGFGLKALDLTVTPFREDFNAFPENGWSIVPFGGAGSAIINPAGQLQITAPWSAGSADYRRVSALSGDFGPTSQYTVTERVYLDQQGQESYQGVGWYESGCWFPLSLSNGAALDYKQGKYDVHISNLLGQWHVWTFVVDHTVGAAGSGEVTGTLTAYEDTSLVGTWTGFGAASGGGGARFSLDGCGGTTSVEGASICHFDYVYADAGLHPPGSGGSSYSLTVNSQVSGGGSLTGVIVSANGQPGTTPFSWTFTASSVSVSINSAYDYGGTHYTFSSWENSNTNPTRSGTLPAGSTTWTATFTASTPPPNTYIVTVLTKDGTGAQFSGVSVTLNGNSQNSPATFSSLSAGTYTISVPSASGSLTFSHWDDGSTSTSRSYTVSQSATLTAYYTGTSTQPPPWDPLAGLRNLLNSFTVREYELMGGSLIVIVSSILTAIALFVKKKTALPLPSAMTR